MPESGPIDLSDLPAPITGAEQFLAAIVRELRIAAARPIPPSNPRIVELREPSQSTASKRR